MRKALGALSIPMGLSPIFTRMRLPGICLVFRRLCRFHACENLLPFALT